MNAPLPLRTFHARRIGPPPVRRHRQTLAWLLAGVLTPLIIGSAGAAEPAHHQTPGKEQPPAMEAPHGHSHVPPGWNLVGFLSGGYSAQGDADARVVDGSESHAEAALLVTFGIDRWRVLAEGVLSTEEAEVERLQLGFQINPGTVAWVGRVHQPSTYWNTEFHHGQYLQSSITRPAIEAWEDDGGPLTQHVVGLLIETEHGLADGTTIRLNTSAGLAPSLQPAGLEPVGLHRGNSGQRFASFAARFDILPDGIGEQAYGLIAGSGGLAARGAGIAGLSRVQQTTLGVYGDVQSGPVRWLGTLYRIRNHYAFITSPGAVTEHSTSWFLHGERRFGEHWLAYLRHESTSGGGALFQQLFPDFMARRSIGGLRLEPATGQAVSLEIGRARTSADRYTEFRVQWSAVFD